MIFSLVSDGNTGIVFFTEIFREMRESLAFGSVLFMMKSVENGGKCNETYIRKAHNYCGCRDGRGVYAASGAPTTQIRKCNLLKQIIFLRQHPIPMLPLLLFFPFFRPLPLFFFLLFHHPQSPEKRTQHLRALFFQHAALDLHLMVKLVHFQHI